MAMKRGRWGSPALRTRPNLSSSSLSSSFPLLGLFLFILLLPLVFFLGRGLSLSSELSESGGSLEQNVDWRQKLALRHLKSFLSKEDINVISANVKNLGPLSLDSFKKNNGFVSWKIVGNENLGVTSPEAKSKDTYGKQDMPRRKQDDHAAVDSPAAQMRRQLTEKRREERSADLIKQDGETLMRLENAAIQHSKAFDSAVLGKDNIWRKEKLLNLFYLQQLKRREKRSADLIKQDDETVMKLENTALPRSKSVDSAVLGKDNIWRKEKLLNLFYLQQLRKKRREKRSADLIKQDDETVMKLENAAILRSKSVDSAVLGKYNIWRRENENENTDSTVRLIRDQMIMASVYISIAKVKSKPDLLEELRNCLKKSQQALGDVTNDADLPRSAPEKMKAMGQVLSKAREQLYDCKLVTGKLRAMLQSAEEQVRNLKKQSTFLSQLAAKTIPNGIHCLAVRLTIDYYLLPLEKRNFPRRENLENPNLYHYALFSDNVLAASVVVNSTVINAKEPEKHVFHLVTDKLNFGAMNMWFLLNPPGKATIHVENVDEFKWLNSTYCPVLRQLESAAMKEYYFKADHPTTFSSGASNLKYRNPKYLSMLNHLRFYLPQIYPKLDKILFLDDDIVVQKDLAPLWSVDLHGKVNGAVDTCGESFHRFDKYLNFSNPHISQNFDPSSCGWAYGMNLFDLEEWKKRDITGIYHKWQNMNEDRTLWKLGTLPPGLITFYGLTHPLEKSWHVLGLGYNPSVDKADIENAAVVHYNGNMKPWLEIAMTKYRSYWTKYIKYDHPYLQRCKVSE